MKHADRCGKTRTAVPSLEDVFVSLIEARDRAEQPQQEVRAMKLRRVWAVARKEVAARRRATRAAWCMAIGIPVLLLVLFGYALTLDVDNVPLVVWDQSGTAREPRVGQPLRRLARISRCRT